MANIKIRNFQSIGSIDLNLTAGVYFIYGKEVEGDANRVGKTALLEAMIEGRYGRCPRGTGTQAGEIIYTDTCGGKHFESHRRWSARSNTWKVTIAGKVYTGINECRAAMTELIGVSYDDFMRLNFFQKAADNLTRCGIADRSQIAIRFLNIQEHGDAISVIEASTKQRQQEHADLDLKRVSIEAALEACGAQRAVSEIQADIATMASHEAAAKTSLKQTDEGINDLAETAVKLVIEMASWRERGTRLKALHDQIDTLRKLVPLEHPNVPALEAELQQTRDSLRSHRKGLADQEARKGAVMDALAEYSPLVTRQEALSKDLQITPAQDLDLIEQELAGIQEQLPELYKAERGYRAAVDAVNEYKEIRKRLEEAAADVKQYSGDFDHARETLQYEAGSLEVIRNKEEQHARMEAEISGSQRDIALYQERLTRLQKDAYTQEQALEGLQTAQVTCPISGAACPVLKPEDVQERIAAVQTQLTATQEQIKITAQQLAECRAALQLHTDTRDKLTVEIQERRTAMAEIAHLYAAARATLANEGLHARAAERLQGATTDGKNKGYTKTSAVDLDNAVKEAEEAIAQLRTTLDRKRELETARITEIGRGKQQAEYEEVSRQLALLMTKYGATRESLEAEHAALTQDIAGLRSTVTTLDLKISTQEDRLRKANEAEKKLGELRAVEMQLEQERVTVGDVNIKMLTIQGELDRNAKAAAGLQAARKDFEAALKEIDKQRARLDTELLAVRAAATRIEDLATTRKQIAATLHAREINDECIRFLKAWPLYQFESRLAVLEDRSNVYRAILTDRFKIVFKACKEFKNESVKLLWNILLSDATGEREVPPCNSGSEEDIINFAIKSALQDMTGLSRVRIPWLFLDEPFSSYSDTKVAAFMTYLQGLDKQYSQIFLSAHDPRLRDTVVAKHIELTRKDGRTALASVTE